MTSEPTEAGEGPERMIRRAIESKFAISPLPQTRRFLGFHIRCVAHARDDASDQARELVIYVPEFLYVLDVGLPAMCGARVLWRANGEGDPTFPDFTQIGFVSVASLDRRDILHAPRTGSLLATVAEGVPEPAVRTALAPFVRSIVSTGGRNYELDVDPYHELGVADSIAREVAIVTSVVPIAKLRDVAPIPGWRIDRVF